MKAFGYAKRKASASGLMEMREVSFTGSPDTIRAVARFLASAADRMEQHGSAFWHEHFRDVSPEWQKEWPDIIVVQPDAPGDAGRRPRVNQRPRARRA